MKNTIKLFGVIALVAVIGFTMTAATCGNSGDSGSSGSSSYTTKNISGTWRAETQLGGWYELDNGKYEASGMYKGTYKVKGSTITFSQTHDKFADGGTTWQEEKRESTAILKDSKTFTVMNLVGGTDYIKQ